MEKIRLTRGEKRLLRFMSNPSNEGRDIPKELRWPMWGLEQHGLAQFQRDERGGVVDARLTPYGKGYLATNPKLRNPLFQEPEDVYLAIIIVCNILTIICVLIRIFVKLKIR